MGYARRVEVSTFYAGKNISSDILKDMKTVTYEDVASGASDSVSIELKDERKKWLGPWFPQKGDRIMLSVAFLNWFGQNERHVHDFGDFQIDDVSANGWPTTLTIGAASMPHDNGFNSEERTKTWENTTLQQIASEIANCAGMQLVYGGDEINIKSLEQTAQVDCKFLYSLCQDYGKAMKVFSNRIVIFDEEYYENLNIICTFHEKDLIDWSFNTTLTGTYTGATFSYSDPDNDEEYVVDIGDGTRVLNINVNADSIYDAELKGIAKLNNENKKATTMSITIKANPYVTAGQNIAIADLGMADGKYYIDKVKMKISGGGATQQTLTLHKIVPRIKNASVRAVEDAQEETKGEGTQYTVVSGDTLWGIAKRFLDAGARYTEIYDLNKEIIEQTAKQHGKTDSSNGHWIWPGEVLTIPPK